MVGVKSASRRFAVVALLAVTLIAGCSTGSAGPHSMTAPSAAGTDNRVLPAVDGGRANPQPIPRSKPKPAVNYCKNNTVAQLVLVDIARQHAWLCARSKTVYSTAVTTGMNHPNTHTPTGHFRIQARNRDTVLTQRNGDTYDVKYWIPFNAPLYGFHDSSWQHFPYGSPEYKTAGSHGCVHMPPTAMKYLYNWAEIGSSVYIRA
jgi:hypothetical protein